MCCVRMNRVRFAVQRVRCAAQDLPPLPLGEGRGEGLPDLRPSTFDLRPPSPRKRLNTERPEGFARDRNRPLKSPNPCLPNTCELNTKPAPTEYLTKPSVANVAEPLAAEPHVAGPLHGILVDGLAERGTLPQIASKLFDNLRHPRGRQFPRPGDAANAGSRRPAADAHPKWVAQALSDQPRESTHHPAPKPKASNLPAPPP
jgi:hypothetical protein